MYSGRRPKPEFWVANSQPAARLMRIMALCHQVCHKLCHAPHARMRRYGLFRYCDRMLPCGLGDGQVVEKDGERGRNRTFNLLIKSSLSLVAASQEAGTAHGFGCGAVYGLQHGACASPNSINSTRVASGS